MLRVGAISYLPDTEIREKRFKAIKQSLQDLRTVIPEDVQITVIAQNYKDIVGLPLKNTTFKHYEAGIGQCAARNILLEEFYASNDDFMLYTDDDTAFYDRYNAVQLFEALHTNPEWFTQVDCFTGIEGRFTPFTAENEKLGLEDKWVFKKMQFATSGEFRCIKNVRKYYGMDLFYDSQLKYGEDLHFRLTKLNKINSFVCRNVICKSRGLVDDMCTLDRMTQEEQEAKYRQTTLDIYRQLGVPVNENGRPNLSEYRSRIPYLAIYINDGTTSVTPGSKTRKLF